MKTPTDQELNIAMCEWMGWRRYGVIRGRSNYPAFRHGDGRRVALVDLPNYLSDASARRLLNEAESRLTELLRPAYENNLYKVCGESWSAVIYAHARQRVIAILQVVKPEIFT